MKVTVYDTEFQRSADIEAAEWQPWDWMEGNWACDCNRRIAFGLDIDAHNTCIGHKRFVVIDSDHNEFHSHSWNKFYPLGLIVLAQRFPALVIERDAAWKNRDRFCGAINDIAGIIGMNVENASEQAVVRNVKYLVRDYVTLPASKTTAQMKPDIKALDELYSHQ